MLEGPWHARKLELLAYDDSYDPTKTETCFKRLQSQNVCALGFFVGTPTGLKYLPMADEAKIPVVGLFSGAQTRSPVHRLGDGEIIESCLHRLGGL